MDSEAEQASEDHAILGKRKRSPQLRKTHGDNPEFVTDLHWERLSPSQDLEIKRQRIPSHASKLDDDGINPEPLMRSTTFTSLPLEILQYICSFLDPFTLGRLLRVSRRFWTMLDPRQPYPLGSGRCKNLRLRSQNAIWTISRQLSMPSVPDPLSSLSELEMMQLVLGSRCQFCGRLPSRRASTMAKSQWNAGPGPEGVRAIWPFKVRSCADCLRARLIREQDLILLSSSVLRPGLPFACFTPSLNYIATVSLQQGSLPAGLQLTKYYFRPQIEELEKQMHQVQTLAPSAYAQWFRGLEPTHEDFSIDVVRIEKWDLSNHLTEQHEMAFPDASSVSSYSGRSGPYSSSYTQSNYTSTTPSSWQNRGGSRKVAAHRKSFALSSFPPTSKGLADDGTALTLSAPPGVPIPSTERNHISTTMSRNAERSIYEVTKIKNQRRTDIEHHCSRLSPPLFGADLFSMKAFNAAIQIAKPLDKTAWELLKPRLLAERRTLQDRNHIGDESASSHMLSRETVVSRDIDNVREATADLMERAHRPTRDKVVEIAQAFIKRCFMGGTNVTAETAPRFAADVLEHVGTHFYELQQREDAELALQGKAPPGDSDSGMRTRRLQLRHMRHVVDSCILPCTELVQKDLFLCSGCEPPEKYFPFLSLIQHYATKHTSIFSRGSRHVYWASEWPSILPFRKPPALRTATSGHPQISDTSSQQLSETRFLQGLQRGRSNIPREVTSWEAESIPSINRQPQFGSQRSISPSSSTPIYEPLSLSHTAPPQHTSEPQIRWDHGEPVSVHSRAVRSVSHVQSEASSPLMSTGTLMIDNQHRIGSVSTLETHHGQWLGDVYHRRPIAHNKVKDENISQEVEVMHPRRIRLPTLDHMEIPRPPSTLHNTTCTSSPAFHDSETMSMKQADEFLSGVDIDDHIPNHNRVGYLPQASSDSSNWIQARGYHDRRISNSTYHATPQVSVSATRRRDLPESPSDERRQFRPESHYAPARSPQFFHNLQSKHEVDSAYQDRHYEPGSRPTTSYQDMPSYVEVERRTANYPRSNVDACTLTPLTHPQSAVHLRYQHVESRDPHGSINREAPPSQLQYKRNSQHQRRYITYVPVNNEAGMDRHHEQQADYDEDTYYPGQRPASDINQKEQTWWTQHR